MGAFYGGPFRALDPEDGHGRTQRGDPKDLAFRLVQGRSEFVGRTEGYGELLLFVS